MHGRPRPATTSRWGAPAVLSAAGEPDEAREVDETVGDHPAEVEAVRRVREDEVRTRELGMRLSRIEMPNADPSFVETLADIVRRELSAVVA